MSLFATIHNTTDFDASETILESCFHCGTICRDASGRKDGKVFCCHGCAIVYDLLHESGLSNYYQIKPHSGIRIEHDHALNEFSYLDDPAVLDSLLDFHQSNHSIVTFSIPSIHCVACVWLLENLYRLQEGVGESKVNFPRKEVRITFDHEKVSLSTLVALLARMGYQPELKWADQSTPRQAPTFKRIHLQLGVAGFAFGNIMLFSLPAYFGMNEWNGAGFQQFFRWLSLLISLPVVFYSASDYWQSAYRCWKRRMLTIELPIALGLAALFAQSLFEVITGAGEGYLDSLCGLVFFLLCGRIFQQKTYDRLSFDRDFRSFFPLSVIRVEQGRERIVSVSEIRRGDMLILRLGDLVPADSVLVKGDAVMDYSFVTGESDPVECLDGDRIYAGGKQMGGRIQIRIVKPVSQSYLTSLWNQEVFKKAPESHIGSLTNHVSRYFTVAVIAIALSSAVIWLWVDAGKALYAFTSVLIVACPCALALAAPFAHGTALRLLGAQSVFVRNGEVLETLQRVDTVVFDKTGTLTQTKRNSVEFKGTPLSNDETSCLGSLARHSTHPHCLAISGYLTTSGFYTEPVRSFSETPGKGVEGRVMDREIWMGSASWMSARGAHLPDKISNSGSMVHVCLQGRYRGSFCITAAYRPEVAGMLQRMGYQKRLALLTGDRERDVSLLSSLLGPAASIHFEQSPHDKHSYIKALQEAGHKVLMVGDGLNDAGALKQSQVGIAVSEEVGRFTPASDVIISADRIKDLDRLMAFSTGMSRVICTAFGVSILYNILGITFAARGMLSPLICAVLMPLSSITVVTFAYLATRWQGRKSGLTNTES
ncbi:heavy metal translocating P-type ATPase metal-binding domain-containing protein [Verrucomicrobia bacterium]|nr:heavy metal translocating P-type ATPase metal-binding domain-containing protein [Verrucomicrobiota bacterium]